MFTLIMSLMFLGANDIVGTVPTQNTVATMPKELEVPSTRKIKKSRGKGRGQSPYFSKFFK